VTTQRDGLQWRSEPSKLLRALPMAGKQSISDLLIFQSQSIRELAARLEINLFRRFLRLADSSRPLLGGQLRFASVSK